MKIEWYCSMCGKEKELILDSTHRDPGATLRKILEDEGWIVQMNYPNVDIYCSKKCAA